MKCIVVEFDLLNRDHKDYIGYIMPDESSAQKLVDDVVSASYSGSFVRLIGFGYGTQKDELTAGAIRPSEVLAIRMYLKDIDNA